MTGWQGFLRALLLQLSNPKIMVFFGSIFLSLLPQNLPSLDGRRGAGHRGVERIHAGSRCSRCCSRAARRAPSIAAPSSGSIASWAACWRCWACDWSCPTTRSDVPAVSEAPASTRRTTFYDELIRRRRAAWIVASVCALVSAGVGLVLSTIVTPIVLLVLGGLLKLVAMLGVVDSLALGGVALIHDFVALQLANFDRLSNTLDRVNGLGDLGLLAQPLARLAPAALPALLAGMLVWLWLRRLFAGPAARTSSRA